jgi:aminopeptidase YwaD
MKIVGLISFLFCLQFYGQSIRVKEFTKTLCSKDFHGRGYVNNGSNIAAEYIIKTFQEIGLAPINGTYFQEFSFDVNTFPSNCFIKLDTHLLQPGIDFLVHPSSGSTCNISACPDGRFFPIKLIQGADFLTKKLLFLNSNKAFDYDNDSVLIVSFIGCKDIEIKEIQAALMQLANSRPIVEITNEKFTWSVSQTAFLYPYIQLKESAFSTSQPAIFLNIENKFLKNFQARNVFGVIKARKETDKTIIISAHYDHLGRMGKNTYFPGANDNASGNGMLLSLAEKLLLKPLKKYNVIFIAFAAEEVGLIGSEFMVKNPILPLNEIRFLLNLDIMGSGEEGVTIVNSTLFDKEFQLLCKLNNRKKSLKQIKPRGPAANSDHYYFTQKGVPSFFVYTMGPNKHYHDVYDTFEELSFNAFNSLSKLLESFIRKL